MGRLGQKIVGPPRPVQNDSLIRRPEIHRIGGGLASDGSRANFTQAKLGSIASACSQAARAAPSRADRQLDGAFGVRGDLIDVNRVARRAGENRAERSTKERSGNLVIMVVGAEQTPAMGGWAGSGLDEDLGGCYKRPLGFRIAVSTAT